MAGSISRQTLRLGGLLDAQGLEREGLSYTLYLPQGYEQARAARYPVIYLLHGANGGFGQAEWDAFFPLLDRLIADGSIPALMAVAPVAGNSYWVDSRAFGPYESAVIQSLIPHIDATYRTRAGRGQRYIAGFSMGGYGALRYSLAYPELFEACLLLSPALQDEEPPCTSRAALGGVFADGEGRFDRSLWDAKNYPALLKTYARQVERVRFFIYAGDQDWNHLNEQDDLPPDAARYNMEVQAVRLYTALRRENLFHVPFVKGEELPGNPARLRIAGGGHDTRLWLKGFEEGLIDLLGGERLV